MARKKGTAIYYPTIESETIAYYDNAVKKLDDGLAAEYGIDNDVMSTLETYNTQIPLSINKAKADYDTAQASTRTKDDLLADAKLDLLRVFRSIQDSKDFEEDDAEDLGFRRLTSAPDLNLVKPTVSGVTVLVDQIIIDWVKRGMDGVIVYGSYDGSRFAEIGRDTRSPYEDTRKNQQAEQPETRYYKMRYMKNDKPIGLETDVVKAVAEVY